VGEPLRDNHRTKAGDLEDDLCDQSQEISWGHTTDNQSLWGTSAEDRELLRKQFDLYDSDLVVCCGRVTTEIFHHLIDFGSEPDWVMTSRGIWYREYRTGHFIIDYAHPEARVSDCLLHYGLIDAVRRFGKTNKLLLPIGWKQHQSLYEPFDR